MAKKVIMTAYNEKSKPATDVLSVNGVSFRYDKPFFLICNYPIQDKAYFELIVDDYYPIKAFRNIPLYVGISKEVSFGVLNSDFIIGSIYYNAETTEYDIMSKYSKQYLNHHTQPEHIYTRLPGAKDIIGVGVDYTENCINIFVNGKLFYKIENKTYDEEGNVLTSFDLTSGTFYFCIWSNVYYKKVLSDFNLNSGDNELENSKEISGYVNFGPQISEYKPKEYIDMHSLYSSYITPPDPEDEDKEHSDSYIIDPSYYDGMNMISSYLGENNCSLILKSTVVPIDANVKNMALTHYPDIDPETELPMDDGVEIIDKYKYTMKSFDDPESKYFINGSTIFINKPIPTDTPVYIEFYVTEGQVKSNKIGIPISVGITGYMTNIINKSSRLDLYHDQWYHYYWKEMDNNSIDPSEYTQHRHEIENVYITTPPEQGEIIGVAFNLAKNKMTVYIDNNKFYTMITNRATDIKTGEVFTIYEEPETNYLILYGDKGTIYQQNRYDFTSKYPYHFLSNTGKNYNGYYFSALGRLELFEENSILTFEKVPEEYNLYAMNGVVYTRIDPEYGTYIELIGQNEIKYTQVMSDIMQRSTDDELFEFRIEEETGNINMWKVNSNRELDYSNLDYSLPWNFTYAFIHDEGAFDGTIKGYFNFGQDPFAATMPDGYISLWEYYSRASRFHLIKDIESKINIVNNNNIFVNLLSTLRLINSGSDYPYSNNGLNNMILNHNIINDEEEHYYTLDDIDISEFTSMIARENNGYIPEEKLNSTYISFEGLVHYNIVVPELENQHIEVFMNGRNKYTTTFQAPKGAFINVKVIADSGYTAGILNIERFTVSEDVILNVTPATLTNYVINIIPTTNQYIKVSKIIDVTEDNEIVIDENFVYNSREVTRFTTTMNDPNWLVEVIPDFGYIAGNVNGKSNYMILNVDKDITISAENAKVSSYVITIPNTVHQIVKVVYNNTPYYSNKINVNNNIDEILPKTFVATYNSVLYVSSYEVDEGYKIDGEFSTMVTVMMDTTIEVPNIVDDMCTIVVNDSEFNGTLTISNSTNEGNVYTVRRGDMITITADAADGLYIKDFILE